MQLALMLTPQWRGSPEDISAIGELADRCGYDSIWVNEHVAA